MQDINDNIFLYFKSEHIFYVLLVYFIHIISQFKIKEAKKRDRRVMPLTEYFIKQTKESWCTIVTLIVLPVLVPYILYGILCLFITSPEKVKQDNYQLQTLPQPNELKLFNSDQDYYFTFAPYSIRNEQFIKQLIKLNNLDSSKTRYRSFPTIEEAEHYINFRQMIENSTSRFTNASFYQDIICEDLEYVYQDYNATYNCSIIDFTDNYKQILMDSYNLTQDDFDNYQTLLENTYNASIFIHFNFYHNQSDTYKDSNIPMNITTEIIYNQTIFNQTLIDNPDQLALTYGNVNMQPYWTGYSYTLLNQINKINAQQYSNVDFNVKYKRNEDVVISGVSAYMFFEVVLLFSISVQLIIATLLASKNQNARHVILRRLGVSEWTFFWSNFVWVFIWDTISSIVQVIIFRYSGVLPFSYDDLMFGFMVWICISFIITGTSCFIATLLGTSSSGPIAVSCLFAFFLVILPGCLLIMAFSGKTVFDPTLVPQWGTWLSSIVLPPLNIINIFSAMTSTTNNNIENDKDMAQYTFKVNSEKVSFKYLFDDSLNHLSQLTRCIDSDSKNTKYYNYKGQCMYYAPQYWLLMLLGLIQSFILMPLLSLWFQYTTNSKAHRRLPTWFIFKKEFWVKRSTLKPGKPDILIKNLSVKYKLDQKCCKCRDKQNNVINSTLGSNIAIKQLNYVQKSGQVAAIVGESNAGKTTSLNFIAGEINSIDLHKFVQKRAKQLKIKNIQVRENTDNMRDDFFNSQTKEEVLNSINYIGEREAKVLENFDLNNPIDCYFLHPYVGLQPQDFSNVWMTMNCFDNVYFSLIFRTKNQGKQLQSKEQCYQLVVDLLNSVGLIGEDVLRRKAKELSGGMLRRLSLACVLAGDPKVLLLDELTAGVDPVVKRAIWNEIQQIRSQTDVTIILSTHDTSEIAEMAQRITIIDKGFTIIEDESPFDLRTKAESYNVKFYDESGKLNYKTSLRVKEQILQLQILEDKDVIIDIVSPHSLQILINKKLDVYNIRELCQILQNIVQQEKFQDFVMSKSKLDDIYIDAIGFDRQSCVNQDYDNEQKDENEEVEMKKKNKTLERLKGLLIKSFKVDTKNTFPSVIAYGLTITLFAVLTWWFCSLFDLVMDLSQKLAIMSNRQSDLADPCFESVVNVCGAYQKPIEQAFYECYLNRSMYSFQQSSSYNDYYTGKCSWYNDYLGLDHYQPNYVSIGDRRQQIGWPVMNTFSINRKDGITNDCNNSYEMDLNDTIDGQFIIANQSIIKLNVDYQSLLQDKSYDPSQYHTTPTSDPGFTQFILERQYSYSTYENDDLTLCLDMCDYNQDTAEQQCNEPLYVDQCKMQCHQNYTRINYSRELLSDPGFQVIDDGTFMNYYHDQVKGTTYKPDFYYRLTNYSHLARELLGPVSNIANVEFDYYDVKTASDDDKQLNGQINITIAGIVPNVGSQANNYLSNEIYMQYKYYPLYTCNGTYNDEDQITTYQYRLERSIVPHSHLYSDSAILQALPDRQRVQMFDMANEPEVILTGALIRKAMFQYADANDYTPYNFTYALVSRGMSYINDGNRVQTSPFSVSQYALTFQTCQITTSLLIPMIYAGSVISSDIENHVIDLLQFHFISKSLWLSSNFIYQTITSIILYIFLIVSDLIFIPDSFLATSQQHYNFGFAVLNTIESSITGILLGLLIQNSRKTVLISFFILLFCMCLAVLSLGSKTFTIIISIFVPSYSLQYEYVQLDGLLPIDVGILIMGIAMSIAQLLFSYVVINWQSIRKLIQQVFKLKDQIERKQNKQMTVASEKQNLLQPQDSYVVSTTDEYAEEKFSNVQLKIKNLHMIYDSGTYALKGINVDIPKSFIFGLIGSNGSGKSTTFNLLSGVYKPTRGKAILYTDHGKVDLFKCNNVSQYFSVVPQHDIYWPNLTVQDHLDLMVYFNALDKKVNMDQIIKQLQLEPFLDQPMSALSGGVRRRVSIALAMTNAPYILALDEVSCGLGLTVKRFVHEAILRILSKDITLVMTSHDMPEIEELVDCVCLMNNGVVVASGSVSQLRSLCNVTFELSLREDKETVNRVAQDLYTDSIEYNEYNDVYVLRLKKEQQYINIIDVLNRYDLLESQWNIEAIRMENVFLEIIKKAEETQEIP